jgi:hypothetical protein
MDAESLLSGLTQIFISERSPLEVGLLAGARAEITLEYQDEDGDYDIGTSYYSLKLEIPLLVYGQILGSLEAIEGRILQRTNLITREISSHWIQQVHIVPLLQADTHWRQGAQAWAAGLGITNQGRVRSDNIATRECDGLLFRSQAEIYLYTALKSQGVAFAPLPVFIHGGETYQRMEPDFVIISDGLMVVVEVDGDTFHHETPQEAHERTKMLLHEGAHVERVNAKECDNQEAANTCAQKLVQIIEKLKSLR